MNVRWTLKQRSAILTEVNILHKKFEYYAELVSCTSLAQLLLCPTLSFSKHALLIKMEQYPVTSKMELVRHIQYGGELSTYYSFTLPLL